MQIKFRSCVSYFAKFYVVESKQNRVKPVNPCFAVNTINYALQKRLLETLCVLVFWHFSLDNRKWHKQTNARACLILMSADGVTKHSYVNFYWPQKGFSVHCNPKKRVSGTFYEVLYTYKGTWGDIEHTHRALDVVTKNWQIQEKGTYMCINYSRCVVLSWS